MENNPPIEAIGSPPPPRDLPGTATQPLGGQPNDAEIQNLKDQVRISERWMIWLTGAIAFFGLCSVGVGILQWNAMRGQLREMKSGGADTHDLAVAAGKQADRTKDLVDRMKDQADRTKIIAEQAIVQAQAANSAAKTASNQLVLGERPWIKI